MSYLGAVRTMPHYNIVDPVNASLEAGARYLAMVLGRKGLCRVKASLQTPSSPLPQPVSARFPGCSPTHSSAMSPSKMIGNVAAFLCSDLANGITGEITYVDGGFNTTALGNTET